MREEIVPCTLSGREHTAYLEIVTDGHYWRTSTLLSAVFICREEDTWTKHLFTADPAVESDEFEVLERLVKLLRSSLSDQTVPPALVTFNGTSFLIPYLTQKLKAYDLEDRLGEFSLRDLYLELRPLYYFLRLPSRRLADYVAFLTDSVPEGEELLCLGALDAYGKLLHGAFHLERTETEAEHLYFTCALENPVPKRISYILGPYYLIAEDGVLRLSVKIEEGRVKRFYTDYKDYYFLPKEGYAIHKSVASFMPKDRLEAATAENCYTWIPAAQTFSEDPAKAEQYLGTVLAYIRAEIRM